MFNNTGRPYNRCSMVKFQLQPALPTKSTPRSETPVNRTRIGAVMDSAERSGLLIDKTGRISGRVSPKLIARAKANTGLSSDTELLEFALASVALEDRFAEAFRAVRGTVDPDLPLGY
jgi:hypothetical protein